MNKRTAIVPQLAFLVFWLLFLGSFSLEAQESQTKPLKVFILVGQSNMQGHAKTSTLPHLGMSSETKPILNTIVDDEGKPREIDDVWISYLSSGGVKSGKLKTGFGASDEKIGPELTFGIYMAQRVKEPILIIKAAWGGKSVHTDFRPPSAGPFQFEPQAIDRMMKQKKDITKVKADKKAAEGVYYRKTIEHVNKVLADIETVYPDYKPEQGYELAGLVWFQGWNDMVDSGVYPERGQVGGYDKYSVAMRHLIRDFRKDLSAPELPIVIGVMGVNGPTDKYGPNQKRYKATHQNFRDAMAAPAKDKEFDGNVVAVLTEDCWDLELDALVERENQVKQKLRKLQSEGKSEKKDWKANLEEARAKEFTEQELKLLETGVSNAAFHYLGSGKIMALIGKEFAESMPLKVEK